MPVRGPTRCRACRKLHTARSALCPTCTEVRYAETRWVYNSVEWARLVDQVLSEEPVCRSCRTRRPREVDHIRTIAAAPRLALVRSNLQALCSPCHGRKTRSEL